MREIPTEKLYEKLTDHNPHWSTGSIDKELNNHPRRKYFDLFFPLITDTTVNRAVVLMGPRRVGKTVLLWHTVQGLIEKGVSPKKIIYIPIDVMSIYGRLVLEDLLNAYKLMHGFKSADGCYVLFDEIQYQSNWDVQLKTLVDSYSKIKFVVSGSAAGALNKNVRESGAGRFTDFLLPPLTFYEYLEFLKLTDALLETDSTTRKALSVKDINGLNTEFINYLNYGGFPEPVFNQSVRQDPKRYIREDIIDKVLLKDLPSAYGINNVRELDNFFRLLIYQTGNEISFDSLCRLSGISKATVEKYLEYLADAFLIRLMPRIDEDGKSFKRRNFFKIYLTNPSMYAALWGLLDTNKPEELGHVVETAIVSQWEHDPRWLDHIYYARFKKGEGEVDMVLKDPRKGISWCLEVKWSDRIVSNTDDLKAVIKFCEKHKLDKATITTCSTNTEKKVSGINLCFRESALICFNLGCNLLRNRS